MTSLVGHTLTRTWRDGHKEAYPIIAQYTSRLSKHYLVIAKWNDHSSNFMEYSTDSYLWEAGQFSISEAPSALSPQELAMQKVYQLQQALKASQQVIRLIWAQGGAKVIYQHVGITDSHGYDDFRDEAQQGEWIEVDKIELMEARSKHAQLWEEFKAAMTEAGIEL